MTQKICLAAICMLAYTSLWPPAVFAVGLGDLLLKSSPNQTFLAEIELTNPRGLEAEEFVASLASLEDFSRADIERSDTLLDLQFRVIRRNDDALVIAITSSARMLEPRLHFMLEITWPSGRILREYSLLLDPPPADADKKVENIRPPVASPDKEITTTAQDIPADQASSRASSTTKAGDTLWKIAENVRPDLTISMQQTMLALLRANAGAFDNNNINLLKAGYVLRIPDIDEILSLPLNAALETVREQNSHFEDYKRDADVIQMDASRRRPHGSTSSTEVAGDELALVSSSQSRGEQASAGDKSDSQALQDELAVSRENLDRAEQENAEISSRLSDLEAQVQTLRELIVLKDNELAELTAMLRKQQAAPSASANSASANKATSVQKYTALLFNPFVLGGLGLLLVVGLASILIFTRKKRQDVIDDVAVDGLLDESSVESMPPAAIDEIYDLSDIDDELIDDIFEPEQSRTVDEDEPSNKLDLARAYIDMGNSEGAKSILDKVIASGTAVEKQEAYRLLAQIS